MAPGEQRARQSGGRAGWWVGFLKPKCRFACGGARSAASQNGWRESAVARGGARIAAGAWGLRPWRGGTPVPQGGTVHGEVEHQGEEEPPRDPGDGEDDDPGEQSAGEVDEC